MNPGRETEEKESEKDSEKELNEIFDFVSIISDALELQILSDDQMMDVALRGSQQIRKKTFLHISGTVQSWLQFVQQDFGSQYESERGFRPVTQGCGSETEEIEKLADAY